MIRNLLVILGDQLDRESSLFRDADPRLDCIWMAEVREESTHVWSHKARIALFLSAMRHFRDELRDGGWTVEYSQGGESLAAELQSAIARLRPQRVRMVEAGDYRVAEALRPLVDDVVTDTHFLSTIEDFQRHAKGRKQFRMEFFYREMRRRHRVLLDAEGQPEGGAWNFDAENRGSFGKQGPGLLLPAPKRFAPDALTRQTIAEVAGQYEAHPGKLEHFDWPVTPADAEAALQDFLDHRLAAFGDFQDAMWASQPWLYHSRLSAALNLKLIAPLRVIEAAEERYRKGLAPLASVEGFIRQILGWREYVRGLYWFRMPQYLRDNALGANNPLPDFYWTGETEMACLRDAIGQTLDYGYAHHIQRLMVTGLYALLAGVDPRQLHEWYLAVYVDAVEWVELPNTIGMSQFADGGVMASKPYVATGKYIDRMSNYCKGCRYDPASTCPFTVKYWEFLERHEALLNKNPRMGMQMRNLRNRMGSQ